MSNAIQVFSFGNHKIRESYDVEHGLLFCASDLAMALGYKDARDLSRNLSAPPQILRGIETDAGIREVVFYTEAELYEVLIRGRRKECKPFKDWVTHEVLPSIRRNGFYCSPHVLANLTQNDSLPVVKALASAIISSQEDLANITEKYNEQCAKADLFKTEAEQRTDAHARLVIKAARADRASQNHKNWESDARDDGMLSKACNTTYKFKSKFERMVYQEMFPKRNKRGFFALLNEFRRVCTFEWFIRSFHPELIPHKDQLELKFAKERHNGSM